MRVQAAQRLRPRQLLQLLLQVPQLRLQVAGAGRARRRVPTPAQAQRLWLRLLDVLRAPLLQVTQPALLWVALAQLRVVKAA